MIDYVDERNSVEHHSKKQQMHHHTVAAKFVGNPFTGAFWTNGEM